MVIVFGAAMLAGWVGAFVLVRHLWRPRPRDYVVAVRGTWSGNMYEIPWLMFADAEAAWTWVRKQPNRELVEYRVTYRGELIECPSTPSPSLDSQSLQSFSSKWSGKLTSRGWQ